MNIVLIRLASFYTSQLHATQFGFRSDKECNNNIYISHDQLQEIAYLSNRKVYTCQVDLTATYDHINSDFFISFIRNCLPRSEAIECIDLIVELYRFTKFYMTGEDSNMKIFQISSGVQKGGNKSPSIFNLFLDYALLIYKHIYKKMGTDN